MTSRTSVSSTDSWFVRAPLLLALLPALVFLAVCYLYPLAAIVNLSVGGWSQLLADPYYLRLFGFSAYQAVLSTMLALAVGLPTAFALARYRFVGHGLLQTLATVPFVLPPLVVAAAFDALLGRNGLLQIGLERGLGPVLLAHVFYNISVFVRVVGPAIATLDDRLAQAAAVLGANRWRTLLRVTLPLLLPSIGAAALLVLIVCFTSFGVILVLGGQRMATVEVEIYRQTAQALRLDVSAALALAQLSLTLLLTLVTTRLERRASARGARPVPARPLDKTGRWLVGAVAVAVGGLCGAPLLALLLRSVSGPAGLTFAYYRALLADSGGSVFAIDPPRAVGNSLLFATAATLIALLVGAPIAALLSRRRTPATAALNVIATLPVGTSALTLGLGYIVALGRPPLNLIGSPLLVPCAHALVALPFVVRTLVPAFAALNPQLRAAAATLGATPARALRTIDLPLVAPALTAAALFAFAVSLGEFGATLLVARPEYPTITTTIFQLLGRPGAANYGRALALSVVLLLVCGLAFAALARLERRGVGDA